MLNNNEIEVIEASPDLAEIKVGSIHLRFCRAEKRIKMISKFDPFREIYDAKALYVKKELFRKACQTAAKIMADRQLAAKLKPKN